MTTDLIGRPCPACRGLGYQKNKDGINVICPVCGGTGKKQKYLEVVW